MIELYHEHNLVFKSHYNIIGMYNNVINIWYWGFILDYVNKNVFIKKKILIQSIEYLMENENNIHIQSLEDLLFRLNNDSIYMNNINNIIPTIEYLLYFIKHTDYIMVYYDEYDNIYLYNDKCTATKIYILSICKVLRI
jgi:hypothetical protein